MFLGGSRYGGKTFGILLDAGYRHEEYKTLFRGILWRRSYKELEEVVLKGKELLGPLGAKYNANTETFNWGDGGFLRLRHLDRDSDADKYQGHQYTWQGFDELQNWPNSVAIDKLWATLRSPAGVPCVRRSTGNPGGAGHNWVKSRYINAGGWNVQSILPEWARDMNLKVEPIKRVWIPLHMEDNRIGMDNDPGYEGRLAESGGPKLFRAWRYGDWDCIEGAYFDWDPVKGGRHVVRGKDLVLPSWSTRWVSMDWGFDHHCAFTWHAYVEETKKYVTYRELLVRQKEAEELAEIIVRTARINQEPLDGVIFSFDCFAHKQDQQTIAGRMNEILMANGLPAGVRGVKNRIQGWRFMGDLLIQRRWVISETCERLREIMPAMTHDPDDKEDCLKFDGDDVAESVRIGLMTRPGPSHIKPIEDFLVEKVPLKRDDGSPTDPIWREIQMKKALVEYMEMQED